MSWTTKLLSSLDHDDEEVIPERLIPHPLTWAVDDRPAGPS